MIYSDDTMNKMFRDDGKRRCRGEVTLSVNELADIKTAARFAGQNSPV